MRYELWANDLFDRDSEPSLQAEFHSAREGLEALWKVTLDEGLQDDGRPTFTWFTLRGPALSVSLPRDPFVNLQLAMLRQRWKVVPRFAATLASLHAAELPKTPSLEKLLIHTTELPEPLRRIIALVAVHLGLGPRAVDSDAERSRDAASPVALTVTGAGWELGALRLSATWAMPEPEYVLDLEGFRGSFRAGELMVEPRDDAGRVLADVLIEAGLPVRWRERG